MRRRNLLFVTYPNGRFDEGLSYAIDLAKTLDKDLMVLVVREKKDIVEKFNDIMVAAAFAEAGEHDTARAMASGDGKGMMAKEKIQSLMAKCAEAGVSASVHTSQIEAVPAVRERLKAEKDIDMVLLGPAVTEDGHVSPRDLNTLVKTATRPVVTITRHAFVA